MTTQVISVKKNWEDMRANQEGKQAGVSESPSFISRTLVQAHVSRHPSCLSVLEQVTDTHQKSLSVNDPDTEGLQLGPSPERHGWRDLVQVLGHFGEQTEGLVQGSDLKGIVHLFAFSQRVR